METPGLEALWDAADLLAERREPNAAVLAMKAAIELDPEGAARRASGEPQYDQDRFALAAPAALADCE